MHVRSGPFHGLATCCLFVVVASELAAQSLVMGTVRDDSTGRVIVGADVLIAALSRKTITSDAGRFAFTGLPEGVQLITVRAVGYSSLGRMIRLGDGDTVRADFALEAMVVQLEPILVEATGPRAPRGVGREAFEERRRLGFGRFIDSTELRRLEFLHLPDVLRRHTSIYIENIGSFGGGKALSGRSRNQSGRYDCYMQVYLDGVQIFRGGRAGADVALRGDAPNLKELIGVSGVEGIEVYHSAAETPAEFGGATAACGTIVLWTRRAP